MKIETILNAYDKAVIHANFLSGQYNKPEKITILYYRRVRQYKSFRTRILKMDAEKDIVIENLWQEIEILNNEIHYMATTEWNDEEGR